MSDIKFVMYAIEYRIRELKRLIAGCTDWAELIDLQEELAEIS